MIFQSRPIHRPARSPGPDPWLPAIAAISALKILRVLRLRVPCHAIIGSHVKTETNNRTAVETLDTRLKTMLPEEYRDSYEAMQPKTMGSAPLRYDADGLVAWDEMWGSFCDLAMAGGPPHKGALLEPGRKQTSTRSTDATTPPRRKSVAASGWSQACGRTCRRLLAGCA